MLPIAAILGELGIVVLRGRRVLDLVSRSHFS